MSGWHLELEKLEAKNAQLRVKLEQVQAESAVFREALEKISSWSGTGNTEAARLAKWAYDALNDSATLAFVERVKALEQVAEAARKHIGTGCYVIPEMLMAVAVLNAAEKGT